ncbi:sensor histidine kinase [Alkalihalobacillus trypoxylicola]|uniref:histidine kinase n=1 Tax=Alkalihalobacillus trypoxylicola TaxID=519424 RepID=A0A161P8M1_9BACI|nr:HAMP domain-containing sensor histidine kinase [Alkalihalobacillus trypoxylicola]KYG27058.1 hypothetical protein AZF04_12045 [Alkalihalobacillus trypoxylicola]
MKLKNYLMFSYFIVMLLPLLALYFIYTSSQYYWQEKNSQIESEVLQEVEEFQKVIEDPKWFTLNPDLSYEPLHDFIDADVVLSVYRSDGLILYQSHQSGMKSYYQFSNDPNLYRKIGELQSNTRGFQYKDIAIVKGEVLGVYEMNILHSGWSEVYQRNSSFYVVLFMLIFIGIYLSVLYLLHKRLNAPLSQLELEMNFFAKGKNIQSAPLKAAKEITQLQKHFNEMKKEITQQQELVKHEQREKEWMVSSLSHDLKTPLTVVRSYSEALWKENYLTELEKEEYKEIVIKKLHYMQQLINDLSIYSSIQSTNYQTELVEVDGEEFFEMLLQGYEELAQNQNIQINTSIETKKLYRLDPKQMIRIMDNLVENGVRHTLAGQNLSLAAISSEHQLPDWVFKPFTEKMEQFRENDTVILVQNQGSFIPSDQIHLVLKPFYQIDQARTKGSSGLGLSIAKLLIEKQNGDLQLYSDKNYGTLIACRIPEREEK